MLVVFQKKDEVLRYLFNITFVTDLRFPAESTISRNMPIMDSAPSPPYRFTEANFTARKLSKFCDLSHKRKVVVYPKVNS